MKWQGVGESLAECEGSNPVLVFDCAKGTKEN